MAPSRCGSATRRSRMPWGAPPLVPPAPQPLGAPAECRSSPTLQAMRGGCGAAGAVRAWQHHAARAARGAPPAGNARPSRWSGVRSWGAKHRAAVVLCRCVLRPAACPAERRPVASRFSSRSPRGNRPVTTRGYNSGAAGVLKYVRVQFMVRCPRSEACSARGVALNELCVDGFRGWCYRIIVHPCRRRVSCAACLIALPARVVAPNQASPGAELRWSARERTPHDKRCCGRATSCCDAYPFPKGRKTLGPQVARARVSWGPRGWGPVGAGAPPRAPGLRSRACAVQGRRTMRVRWASQSSPASGQRTLAATIALPIPSARSIWRPICCPGSSGTPCRC